MPSARREPSSGTRTRLYIGRLLLTSARGSSRRLSPRGVRGDQKDRRPTASQHGLGNRTADATAKAVPSLGAHHDHVGFGSTPGTVAASAVRRRINVASALLPMSSTAFGSA